MATIENLEVIHNEAENRFETWVDGQLSKLDYSSHGNTIMMLHGGVYPDHRGQGIAGEITNVGHEYARKNNMRVIPMCSYVAAYIRKHPEYADLMKPRPEA